MGKLDMSKNWSGLRDAAPSSSSGKRVCDTDQLSGEAKDSLGGKNSTVQYETNMPKIGTLGGKSKNN